MIPFIGDLKSTLEHWLGVSTFIEAQKQGQFMFQPFVLRLRN
jgi:hypothetical protein